MRDEREEAQAGVSVTLKGGQNYDAPWIVIHAPDSASALSLINDPQFAELQRRTTAAASFFRSVHLNALRQENNQ